MRVLFLLFIEEGAGLIQFALVVHHDLLKRLEVFVLLIFIFTRLSKVVVLPMNMAVLLHN